MSTSGVERAMRKGIAFIAAAQKADGSFESFSSPAEAPFQSGLSYQTTFGPTFILSALASIDSPQAHAVRNRLAAWLLKQRSPLWSFNYWAASAPQRASLPYPDDLDDTFCALSALRQHNPELIDEECLGSVVKLLIAAEQQVGGPYRTWLVDKSTDEAWKDADLAVNSNIAYFLSLVAEALPNLTALMDRAIESREFTSPYYPSAYPIAYFVARAYKGTNGDMLASYTAGRKRGGWWGSPLKTALALLTLTALGKPLDRHTAAIERLLEAQLPDGSWPAEAFCLDPAIHGKPYYSGSPALTTAFVLQALAQPQNTGAPEVATPSAAKRLSVPYERIVSAALSEMRLLGPNLKRKGLAALGRMKKGDDNREIVLLPYFFNSSLAKPLEPQDIAFDHLGLANLYGWTAYTIYDDFMDNEGKPQLLPVANTALRYSVRHFGQAVPASRPFKQLVGHTFDDIEEANSWELAHCRMQVTDKSIILAALPQYSTSLSLADRSLGHTLTPMAVLTLAGIEPNDPRALQVRLALRHYLAARQLNDDIHDWEQDLKSGIITYAVAAILRELSLPLGEYTFARLLPKMQRQFWNHTLNTLCATTSRHTKLARESARSSRLLAETNIITQLIAPLDAAVSQSLQEQARAKKFLKSYRSNPVTQPAEP